MTDDEADKLIYESLEWGDNPPKEWLRDMDMLRIVCLAGIAAERARLLPVLIDVAASLAASISLLEHGGKKAAASDKIFAIMLSDYNKSLAAARAAVGEEPK